MTSADGFRIEASAAQRIYIVKADDFGRGPVLDRWRKFIDLSIEAGLVPSIGVVGSDFAQNAPARALARFAADSYGCEFWNHSNAHADLRAMTSAERTQDAARCHDILAEALGAAPIAYGAPFNAMDADCARDIAAAASYRVFFDEAAGASGAWELPRDWYATPEVRTQVFRPMRIAKFVAAMAQRSAEGDAPPVVMQVHPSYWSDECFGEFEKTLRLLFERGYEPFTVAQFADWLDARRTPERERLSLGAVALGLRESGADFSLMRLAGHLRRFPVRDPREDPNANVALIEVGRGAGRWALAAAAADNGVRATAITTAAEPSVRAASRGLVEAGALKFATEPGRYRFDVFIADDPQTSWEETLCQAGRVLRPSGRAFVRRRSEIALFAELVDAAGRRDRARVVAALEAVVRLAGRRLGVVPAAGAPAFLNDCEFSTLAIYAGLQPQLRLSSSRLTPQRFLGASLVVEDLLICTASSQRRAKQLAPGLQATTDDIVALASAGAVGILGGISEGLERWEPAALMALCVALGGEAGRRLGEDCAAFVDFARAVHAQDWGPAAELAASRGLPVSAAGRDVLRWLGGEAAAGSGDDLLSRLMRARAKFASGGEAFADVLAAFAPSRKMEELLQTFQAGPSPDNVYPFVEISEQQD